jgi:hypothetical protein
VGLDRDGQVLRKMLDTFDSKQFSWSFEKAVLFQVDTKLLGPPG